MASWIWRRSVFFKSFLCVLVWYLMHTMLNHSAYQLVFPRRAWKNISLKTLDTLNQSIIQNHSLFKCSDNPANLDSQTGIGVGNATAGHFCDTHSTVVQRPWWEGVGWAPRTRLSERPTWLPRRPESGWWGEGISTSVRHMLANTDNTNRLTPLTSARRSSHSLRQSRPGADTLCPLSNTGHYGNMMNDNRMFLSQAFPAWSFQLS